MHVIFWRKKKVLAADNIYCFLNMSTVYNGAAIAARWGSATLRIAPPRERSDPQEGSGGGSHGATVWVHGGWGPAALGA